jgi:group II intron reverse transcriptase/maturase
MIEKVIEKMNMAKAIKQTISNKGASGVDGMQVGEIKPYVQQHGRKLYTDIINRKYKAQAIRGVEIPKGNGKTRLLGVPTVIERVLQQAVSQVISPYFESEFKDESYGFRPNRNALQAVQKSEEYINAGYKHIVDIDLKSFFDEVEHSLLLELIYKKVKCPTTLRLIRKWLRAPIEINGKLTKRRKGIPQGSPISPLLSNIMLHELDKYLEKQRHKFVRYADDFSIYTKGVNRAKEIGNKVYLFLKNKLKLPINRDKSGIRRPSKFKILGYGYTSRYEKGAKGKYQLIVSEKSWQKLKQNLKEITRKTKPYSFDERMRKLKEVQRGWVNYFRMGNIVSKLQSIDSWIRNRLRYCIWHDWKKPERKRKNLIRLGVKPHMAYAWSRSRKGGWAIAQSPILITTVTNARLAKRGYESLEDYYQKVQAMFSEPPST